MYEHVLSVYTLGNTTSPSTYAKGHSRAQTSLLLFSEFGEGLGEPPSDVATRHRMPDEPPGGAGWLHRKRSIGTKMDDGTISGSNCDRWRLLQLLSGTECKNDQYIPKPGQTWNGSTEAADLECNIDVETEKSLQWH
ncbi:hypothetical protein K438DRAFT_1776556 [Mycena galopus ATCC 62051]|nr:hypothetical protein K438DRAFT_1776556 [Mycena galopus ATCC 62051]